MQKAPAAAPNLNRQAANNEDSEGAMTIALVEEARIVRNLSGLLGNLYFQPVLLHFLKLSTSHQFRSDIQI